MIRFSVFFEAFRLRAQKNKSKDVGIMFLDGRYGASKVLNAYANYVYLKFVRSAHMLIAGCFFAWRVALVPPGRFSLQPSIGFVMFLFTGWLHQALQWQSSGGPSAGSYSVNRKSSWLGMIMTKYFCMWKKHQSYCERNKRFLFSLINTSWFKLKALNLRVV